MISAWLLAAAVTATAGAPDRAAYEAAAAAAGRDAAAQVDLALWCEARGMPAERLKHLTRAVLLDPEDARARGLLGQVRRDGRWMRAADVARSVEESPATRALMGEYLERRARAADRADDQYKLALWCEEQGLKEPMAAHLRRTLQLDAGREGAWRRLGFKKVGGRWVDPTAEAAAKAAREARAQADKEWTSSLEKIRSGLSSRDEAKRAAAREALATIDDPRAVPALWRAFVAGGVEPRQRAATEAFGRIDGRDASIALATLAVFSPHAAIRTDASALLARRDPREFASYLASLIRKETRYQIKEVEGPGTSGVLAVRGEGANVVRRYTPMAPLVAPGTVVSPNEVLTTPLDMPSPSGMITGPLSTMGELAANRQAALDRMKGPLQAGLGQSPGGAAMVDQVLSTALPAPTVTAAAASFDPNDRRFQESPITVTDLQVPIGRMVAETRMSAMAARAQLEADVRELERQAAPIREVNERAAGVLKAASGRDFGDDPGKWAEWAVDLEGYSYTAAPTPEPPTYVEEVPIAFQPQAAPTLATRQVGTQIVTRHACFAAGTPVATLSGPHPIESISAGDQVLSQDVSTGEFRYRAVGTVYHNPPNETYRVSLGADSIVATGIHRFWKAGRGWVLARELVPGDRLRTVGGSAEVTAVEKDRVQPVFNLQVVGGDSFCVGAAGVVAHDNSLAAPVAKPFDAVPALAAATKP